MLTVVLALSCAMFWGISNFLGGLGARRMPSLSVTLLSQAFGLLFVFAILLLRPAPLPEPRDLLITGLAGLVVVTALAAMYRGFAVGSVSVVAPIAAVGSIVPVTWGFLFGERVHWWQAVGMAVAIVGVALVARARPKPGQVTRALGGGVGYGILSALCFGIFYVLLAEAKAADPVWSLTAVRLTGLLAVGASAAVARPNFILSPRMLFSMLVVGVTGTGANVLLAYALTLDMLGLTSVLSSLSPVIPVILGRFWLGEHISTTQNAGIGLALVGIVLMAIR
jgi:drug/metabolite transporter (DMT)-like permease